MSFDYPPYFYPLAGGGCIVAEGDWKRWARRFVMVGPSLAGGLTPWDVIRGFLDTGRLHRNTVIVAIDCYFDHTRIEGWFVPREWDGIEDLGRWIEAHPLLAVP